MKNANELDGYLDRIGIPKHLRRRALQELKPPDGYFKALRDCITGIGGVIALSGRGSIELGLASLSTCATSHHKSIHRMSYEELAEKALVPGKIDIGGDDVVAVTFVPEADPRGFPVKIAEWMHNHVSIGRTAILLTQAKNTPFDSIGLDIWKFHL